MNFYFDEWDWVSYARQWNVDLLLLPHNEHWSTIPLLVWKLLFTTVGIRSHIPYEIAALAMHATCVLLLFALVRRRSGDFPAFTAALILLVLGSGGTDIVWAFQIGWLMSIAFGLFAILTIDGDSPFPRRMFVASASLLCSLMSSGVGLAFAAALAFELASDPRRRRFLLVLVVPAITFAEWFLAFGAGLPGSPGAPCATCVASGFSADTHTAPLSLAYIFLLVDFALTGIEASLGGIAGQPVLGTALLPIVLVLLAVRWASDPRANSRRLGMFAGLLAWFGIVSLGRVKFGSQAAADPHYVYVGVVFLLPLLADLVRDLPSGRVWQPLIAATVALCAVGNIVLLRDAALSRVDLMQTENAELQTMEVFRGAPEMALNRGLDHNIMPQLNAGPYFAATDQLGSPVPSASIATLTRLDPRSVDQAMLNLFGDSVSADADSSPSTQGLWCETVDPTTGLTVDLQIPDGESLLLRSDNSASAELFLSFLAPPPAEPLRDVEVLPRSPVWIHVPNTRVPIRWRLRIDLIGDGPAQICGSADIESNLSDRSLYRAEASGGQLGAGWSAAPDADAYGGYAARAAQGTVRYNGIVFGRAFLPSPGVYDVYYRLKVANANDSSAQMTLSLLDSTLGKYMAASTLTPRQVGTSYVWLRVATRVVPTSGHLMRYQSNVVGTLSTDWYIDDAALVPAGTSVVQPRDAS